MRHIALVGLPGVGKTTVGRLASRRLAISFVDLDAFIVSEAGRPIPELFAEHGEQHFRDLETNAVRSVLARSERTVVSTGGGVVLREVNRSTLGSQAWIGWLRADLNLLSERVRRNTNRPLVSGDAGEKLKELDRERRALYAEVADVVIDVDDLSPSQVADCVVELSLRDPDSAEEQPA